VIGNLLCTTLWHHGQVKKMPHRPSAHWFGYYILNKNGRGEALQKYYNVEKTPEIKSPKTSLGLD
jgi:hypothetical protein